MHLDRPSIHKEGPWSIAIFHQGPHPIASISRPWEKLPWWIPSQCRYAKRGPKLPLRCGQPGGHRVPGTFPTGETRFTCWSCWCYQKWKVGWPQGTCFTTQGWHWLEYQNGSFDGKWWNEPQEIWGSFGDHFPSTVKLHQSHLLNQLLRSTLLAGLVGGTEKQSLHFEVFGGTKNNGGFLIFCIHLNTFELFELCTKTTSLPGCQSDHWGEDLDGGILLSGRWVFFSIKRNFFWLVAAEPPQVLKIFLIYMCLEETIHATINKTNKTNRWLFFWCLKDFYRSTYPALGKSPGWPMLLKKHHSWPLAVFEKMCFVEDHGILKGANAYDFCVIWGCYWLPQPSCFQTWEMVNCIWTGMSKHWLHLRSRRTVIKRYNKPEKSERATSY